MSWVSLGWFITIWEFSSSLCSLPSPTRGLENLHQLFISMKSFCSAWCVGKCTQRAGSDAIAWDWLQRRSPWRRAEEWARCYTNGVLQKWVRQIPCSWPELGALVIKLRRHVIANCLPVRESDTLASKSYPGNFLGFSADFTGFQQLNGEVEFSLKARQRMQKSGLRKKLQKRNCWCVSPPTRRRASERSLPLLCLIPYLQAGKRKFPRTHDP